MKESNDYLKREKEVKLKWDDTFLVCCCWCSFNFFLTSQQRKIKENCWRGWFSGKQNEFVTAGGVCDSFFELRPELQISFRKLQHTSSFMESLNHPPDILFFQITLVETRTIFGLKHTISKSIKFGTFVSRKKFKILKGQFLSWFLRLTTLKPTF